MVIGDVQLIEKQKAPRHDWRWLDAGAAAWLTSRRI